MNLEKLADEIQVDNLTKDDIVEIIQELAYDLQSISISPDNEPTYHAQTGRISTMMRLINRVNYANKK